MKQRREDEGLSEKNVRLIVDENLCSACGLCGERAPDNLAMADDGWVACVIKQPADAKEISKCEDAVDFCPTGGLTASEVRSKENAA